MAGRAPRFLSGLWADASPMLRGQKGFTLKNWQVVVFIMLLTTLASTFCTEMPSPKSFRPGSRASDVHGKALNATLTGSTITPTSLSSASTSSLSMISASSSGGTLAQPRRLRGSKTKAAVPDGTYSIILGNLPFMAIGMMLACKMPGPHAQVGGQ